MTASVAHPCSSRAEVLAVLREHFPGLAAEFKLCSRSMSRRDYNVLTR